MAGCQQVVEQSAGAEAQSFEHWTAFLGEMMQLMVTVNEGAEQRGGGSLTVCAQKEFQAIQGRWAICRAVPRLR